MYLRAATALTLVVGYYVLKRALRAYLLRTYTGVTDLAALGRARAGGKIQGAAVVCGGSIGGLLSARVLSDHFARVVVVEPETWALSPEASSYPDTSTGRRTVGDYETISHKRARVYQYTAIHVYQVLLTRFLRALFPGFDERAKERGLLIAPADMNVRFSGWEARAPHGEYAARGGLPEILYCSRRAFENFLRSLVKGFPGCENVEYLNGTVMELKLSVDARCVDAVAVRGGGEGGAAVNIPCELVVDCTGNTQAGLKLLSRALPIASARKLGTIREQYDPQMFYTTLEFPIPDGFEERLARMNVDPGAPESMGAPQAADTSRSAWWLTYTPDPDVDNRGVFVGRKENGIVFGAGGWASETPVTLEQLVEYARGTRGEKPMPAFFFEICEMLEPVAEKAVVFEARINACSRVAYEKAPDAVPRNFVALGDATMRLNPRFGEGVTKCAVGVATLDGALRSFSRSPKEEDAFGRTFFKRLASRTQDKWDATRFTDYGRDTTTPVPGENLQMGAFSRWYKSRLNRVLERDDAASSAMWHHMMFLAPATDLMAPSIVAKVLWEALFPTPVPSKAESHVQANMKAVTAPEKMAA